MKAEAGIQQNNKKWKLEWRIKMHEHSQSNTEAPSGKKPSNICDCFQCPQNIFILCSVSLKKERQAVKRQHVEVLVEGRHPDMQ